MASSTAQEFFQRYEQVKAVEQSRNELIEVLIAAPFFFIWLSSHVS